MVSVSVPNTTGSDRLCDTGLPKRVPWAETAALLCWSCCTAEDAVLRFLEDSSELGGRQVGLLARVGLAHG
jgi:hypothetical protein